MFYLIYKDTGNDIEHITVIQQGAIPQDTENYVVLNEIPEPEKIIGKSGMLVYKKSTDEVMFNYYERPLTLEEEVEQLKAENALLNETVDMLILDNLKV